MEQHVHVLEEKSNSEKNNMHEWSTFKQRNSPQILHGFLTWLCGPAELASQKSGADCSGNSSLLKETHSSRALNLLAFSFSPPQGHMLAEACSLHNLHSKVLRSYTALVEHMPVSTLPDLSTALNIVCRHILHF